MADWRLRLRPGCAASFVHERDSGPARRHGLRANGARGYTPRRKASFEKTTLARSWVFSRSDVNRAEVEQIGVRVVALDLEHFGDEPASRAPFDLHDDVQRISDICLHGTVRRINAALQAATCETSEPLFRRTRMNC